MQPATRSFSESVILAAINYLDELERYNDSCKPSPEKGLRIVVIRLGRGVIKAARIYLLESQDGGEELHRLPQMSQREIALAAKGQPQHQQETASSQLQVLSPSAKIKGDRT